MTMPKPKVRVQNNPGVLTINLSLGSWNLTKDVFGTIAEAIKERALFLSGGTQNDKDDAKYFESIADEISVAVQRADDREHRNISNVFG